MTDTLADATDEAVEAPVAHTAVFRALCRACGAHEGHIDIWTEEVPDEPVAAEVDDEADQGDGADAPDQGDDSGGAPQGGDQS